MGRVQHALATVAGSVARRVRRAELLVGDTALCAQLGCAISSPRALSRVGEGAGHECRGSMTTSSAVDVEGSSCSGWARLLLGATGALLGERGLARAAEVVVGACAPGRRTTNTTTTSSPCGLCETNRDRRELNETPVPVFNFARVSPMPVSAIAERDSVSTGFRLVQGRSGERLRSRAPEKARPPAKPSAGVDRDRAGYVLHRDGGRECADQQERASEE